MRRIECATRAVAGDTPGFISISAHCEQSITNNCTYNGLSDFSWWTDRNGDQMKYWHGAHPYYVKGCYCSLEGDGCDADAHGDTVSFFVHLFLISHNL